MPSPDQRTRLQRRDEQPVRRPAARRPVGDGPSRWPHRPARVRGVSNQAVARDADQRASTGAERLVSRAPAGEEAAPAPGGAGAVGEPADLEVFDAQAAAEIHDALRAALHDVEQGQVPPELVPQLLDGAVLLAQLLPQAQQEAAAAAQRTAAPDDGHLERVLGYVAIGAVFGTLIRFKNFRNDGYPPGVAFAAAAGMIPKESSADFGMRYFATEGDFLPSQAKSWGLNLGGFAMHNYVVVRVLGAPRFAVPVSLLATSLAVSPLVAGLIAAAKDLNATYGDPDNPHLEAVAEATGIGGAVGSAFWVKEVMKVGYEAAGENLPRHEFYKPGTWLRDRVSAVMGTLWDLERWVAAARADPGGALLDTVTAPLRLARSWLSASRAYVGALPERASQAWAGAAEGASARWAAATQTAARGRDWVAAALGAAREAGGEAVSRTLAAVRSPRQTTIVLAEGLERSIGGAILRAGEWLTSARAFVVREYQAARGALGERWRSLRTAFRTPVRSVLSALGSLLSTPLRAVQAFGRGLLVKGAAVKALKSVGLAFFLPALQSLIVHMAEVMRKSRDTGDARAAATSELATLLSREQVLEALSAGWDMRPMASAAAYGRSEHAHDPERYDPVVAYQEMAALLGEVIKLDNTFWTLVVDAVDAGTRGLGSEGIQEYDDDELRARLETALPSMGENVAEVLDILEGMYDAGVLTIYGPEVEAEVRETVDEVRECLDERREATEDLLWTPVGEPPAPDREPAPLVS